MAATSLEVFDRTLHTTNVWLDEIMVMLDIERRVAWKVLSVVLQKLRDRMPVELSAHLSAELPLVVRGAYYDQFKPSSQPTDCDLEGFVAEVAEKLSDTKPVNASEAVRAVFSVLSGHLPHGQIAKVQRALPEKLRTFWQSADAEIIPPPDRAERRSEGAQRHKAARENPLLDPGAAKPRGL
jgi:uncharacterized protein (DUF2267 family)